jgi:hypothetical protein
MARLGRTAQTPTEKVGVFCIQGAK